MTTAPIDEREFQVLIKSIGGESQRSSGLWAQCTTLGPKISTYCSLKLSDKSLLLWLQSDRKPTKLSMSPLEPVCHPNQKLATGGKHNLM